jgi:hypothetical protein
VAASVTGPTNTAAAAAILADGSLVAPRAQNAFEVAVIGLLDIVPAASGGLPGIMDAIHNARQDTFDALNAPIVPNPTPSVRPTGILQVAVVGAMNIVAAVIFPGFNDILGAAFSAPDAAAQELAATGDPVRAVVAGLSDASESFNDAVSVIQQAVREAVHNVRTEAGHQPSSTTSIQLQRSAATAVASTSGSTKSHAAVKRHSATHDVDRPVRALDR